MSEWFKHRHNWRSMTDLNTITEKGAEKPVGGFFLEECYCGGVRQIEFRAGEAPKVFVTENGK